MISLISMREIIRHMLSWLMKVPIDLCAAIFTLSALNSLQIGFRLNISKIARSFAYHPRQGSKLISDMREMKWDNNDLKRRIFNQIYLGHFILSSHKGAVVPIFYYAVFLKKNYLLEVIFLFLLNELWGSI